MFFSTFLLLTGLNHLKQKVFFKDHKIDPESYMQKHTLALV